MKKSIKLGKQIPVEYDPYDRYLEGDLEYVSEKDEREIVEFIRHKDGRQFNSYEGES